MKPDVVADVGNSRVKWGRCLDVLDGRVVDSVSLPADDPGAWQKQLEAWYIAKAAAWAVSGVHPQRRDHLVEWLRQRGDQVTVFDSWQQLPLRIQVEHPERVGIDRLLNAVAACGRGRRGAPTILIDVGSAVTVDSLDASDAFVGGAIFPGLRLMAQALHDYTALLPLVEVKRPDPPMPGTSTVGAVEAGVLWAVAGGIRALVDQLQVLSAVPPAVFLTGGDGPLLAKVLAMESHVWPNMTLEGIRFTAETMP